MTQRKSTRRFSDPEFVIIVKEVRTQGNVPGSRYLKEIQTLKTKKQHKEDQNNEIKLTTIFPNIKSVNRVIN